MEKIQQAKFLPTVNELQEMGSEEFEEWTSHAVYELARRKNERDPYPNLKTKLKSILENPSLNETHKEVRILEALQKFSDWYL
ncbi:hypothetical protein SAMN05421839_10649 [Halolactibacillus halophilus]|uniref:Uncharacterized protein n=1 Tax=Halolactibacillus halophilus TaxID=306540 RepID=A0A1I5MRV0_9BACI|nr:hypothetical protein [Halolactibacillus halophilus]GEM01222.1 hypothetical protein HHA03_07540 [Halolactibacillus halophilus]SFP11686.1 hypothetical protein SAMN05421839_10649 [Halolactibacillus halophilus]